MKYLFLLLFISFSSFSSTYSCDSYELNINPQRTSTLNFDNNTYQLLSTKTIGDVEYSNYYNSITKNKLFLETAISDGYVHLKIQNKIHQTTKNVYCIKND